MPTDLLESIDLPFPRKQGKVRDVFDLGDSLLIVSSDRISAFDWILPNAIPDKGAVLTQMSAFWFQELQVEHHMLSLDLPPQVDPSLSDQLFGRAMHVKKAEVVPFECVVRGYLEGSGWKDYQETKRVCGIELPRGMRQCDRLPEPLFTPATKAESGHDENVPFEVMCNEIGSELATRMRDLSLQIYSEGLRLAESKGIIIADTKFEFGLHAGELILIDEVLTPDSSRFWPADDFEPGRPQKSFDKQFVREYLIATAWDRNSPPPQLPNEIIEQTRSKYTEAFERIAGATIA